MRRKAIISVSFDPPISGVAIQGETWEVWDLENDDQDRIMDHIEATLREFAISVGAPEPFVG